jgi:hypothetical protein
VVGVTAECGRGVDLGARLDHSDDLARGRVNRLLGRAVLRVEKIEVYRRAAGQRERSAILADALLHSLGGVGGARISIPPGGSAAAGDPGEHVDHRHLLWLSQEMPAREDRVIEVRGEDHRGHQRTVSFIRGDTVNGSRKRGRPPRPAIQAGAASAETGVRGGFSRLPACSAAPARVGG